LEWLTLLPDWTAFPVSSQRRDIAQLPLTIGIVTAPAISRRAATKNAGAANRTLASWVGRL
jgi:hypothetical protein